MNDKIKELMERAKEGENFSVEKFAEELVRECSKVAKKCAEGSLAVSLAIKHHFGIYEKPTKEKSDE